MGYDRRQGTPVIAAHDGVIDKVVTGTDAADASLGVRVRIKFEKDGKDYWSDYGHMKEDEYLPAKGQEIKQGDRIGSSGNTGTNTTGPHLHLEVLNGPDNSYGDYYDRLEDTSKFLPEKNYGSYYIDPEK